MNEPEVLEDGEEVRFVRDVELLRAGRPVSEETSSEASDEGDASYQADLAMADLLMRAKFVPSAEFKRHLRNKLQSQSEIKRRDSMLMVTSSLFRQLFKGAVAVGLTAVLVLGTVLVLSPEARAQAEGLVARFVEVESPWALLVPEASDAEAPRPAPPAPDLAQSPVAGLQEVLPAPADLPELTLPRGDALRLAEPTMISLEEAQNGTSFTIKMPTSLPEGYSFQGVLKRPSLPAPDNSLPRGGAPAGLSLPVTLLFENAAGEKLMLTEISLPVPPAGAGQVPLPAGRGSVQEVSVNGQPGQYVEGAWARQGWDSGAAIHQLRWQGADGVTYMLISQALGLDELLSIAQSIP
jgi:hypothetical protein